MAVHETLLAKRPRDVTNIDYAETFVGHAEAVMNSAEQLLEMLAPAFKQLISCSEHQLRLPAQTTSAPRACSKPLSRDR